MQIVLILLNKKRYLSLRRVRHSDCSSRVWTPKLQRGQLVESEATELEVRKPCTRVIQPDLFNHHSIFELQRKLSNCDVWCVVPYTVSTRTHFQARAAHFRSASNADSRRKSIRKMVDSLFRLVYSHMWWRLERGESGMRNKGCAVANMLVCVCVCVFRWICPHELEWVYLCAVYVQFHDKICLFLNLKKAKCSRIASNLKTMQKKPLKVPCYAMLCKIHFLNVL